MHCSAWALINIVVAVNSLLVSVEGSDYRCNEYHTLEHVVALVRLQEVPNDPLSLLHFKPRTNLLLDHLKPKEFE